MKTTFQAALLCVALVSSLARAAAPVDLDVSLKLKDPLWEESRLPMQVLTGLLGGVLLAIPGSFAGFMISDRRVVPPISCDQAGCTIGGAANGYLGMMIGGYVGLCLGTGVGVSLAGYAQGGSLPLLPAISGAGLGGVIALFITAAASLLLGIAGVPVYPLVTVVIPAVMVAGAIGGSILLYQASQPVRSTARGG